MIQPPNPRGSHSSPHCEVSCLKRKRGANYASAPLYVKIKLRIYQNLILGIQEHRHPSFDPETSTFLREHYQTKV